MHAVNQELHNEIMMVIGEKYLHVIHISEMYRQ